MKRFIFCAVLALASLISAHASPCLTASLSTYLNSGGTFVCSESGGSVTTNFNHDILSSYVGLNLLPSLNSSANPANINVIPGSPGLMFESGDFSVSSTLLASQAEMVHFQVNSTTPILSTSFFLENALISTGNLQLGTGLAIGQELVCVGGTFTSLPTGLITSVTNGLLGSGQFGCNGTAIIGTVASSSGPLNAITGVLGLPDLTGVTSQALIQLSPTNQTTIDVIKIQALLAILNGSASTTGFGNTFAVQAGVATPELGSARLFLTGVSILWISIYLKRRRAGAKASVVA
jgi:hypothetical protein